MPLTDIEIRKAKARPKPYRLSDNGGMYLWVTPSGGRLWRWAYVFERREKLMALGKYPVVSLSTARELHLNARKLLASGIDPMAQRKLEKNAERAVVLNSFASVAAQWLDSWQDGKSSRHAETVRRRMAADILPVVGARPIAEIEAPELVAMVKAIQLRGARDIAKEPLRLRVRYSDTPWLMVMRDGIRRVKSGPATSLDPCERSTMHESMQRNSRSCSGN